MAPFRRRRPAGLFVQVLEWMLLPLLLIWPLVMLATYFAANVIAEATYDHELRDMSRAVAEEARSRDLRARDPVLPVMNSLRNDSNDHFLVQVARNRKVLAGDRSLDIPDYEPIEMGLVEFRDARVGSDAMRVAFGWFESADGDPLLVQIAQPMKRRRDLVRDVTAIVMGVLVLLVPVTVGLMGFGLKRGLRPLLSLRDRVEARDPQDLSPIPQGDVPAEIAPVVNTLNHQLDRVRRTVEAQRRFVADAAHQMRTPLAGLKTQAQAALRVATLEEAHTRLAQIEQSADRMSRLVAQLLALARADDAAAAVREPVDLNALLHEVCASSADLALAKGVTLGFEPAGQPVSARGSALLLREMFANLVDNAVRYTPAGGDVLVRVDRRDEACVSVEDSGSGIPQAERELVFERFHRVLGTGQSGSGLGLSIVKAIAELHGAMVRLQDGAGGRGTRFDVVFPA